jgi:hypothetical protein
MTGADFGAAVPLVLGVSVVFAVSALMVSLFAIWRTRAMVDAAERRIKTANEKSEALMRRWRDSRESISVPDRDAAQRDLPREVVPVAAAGQPKSSLNINKRSQVLRMQRRGNTPEQIAIALEVPLQEVDLLLKVQRIVLGNL